jgi:putative phage-type endonuclease
VKRILDKRNMTEADWQDYRASQTGIGGSEVATILGINPYKSKFLLWLEKTGQTPREDVNNQFVEWGNLLEPIIREKFKAETGFKVYQNNFVLVHDTHEFMVANLDGEVQDPAFSGRGVLEIKTASERKKKDWEMGVPIHYLAQIQHYLAVTGYEYAYCAVLIGGNTFKYFFIERDDYIIDKIISAELEFTEMVKKRIPPEISGSKTESEWLQATFPDAVDEEMMLSPDIEMLALEYHTLADEVKAQTKRLDEIKNQIKLIGKEYKTLKSDHIKISMPTINKVLFDSKRFSQEYPDLYAQYKTKQSSYRGFDISILEK